MICEFCDKSLNRRNGQLRDVLEQLKTKRGFPGRGWDANNLCLALEREARVVTLLAWLVYKQTVFDPDSHQWSMEMLWFLFMFLF